MMMHTDFHAAKITSDFVVPKKDEVRSRMYEIGSRKIRNKKFNYYYSFLNFYLSTTFRKSCLNSYFFVLTFSISYFSLLASHSLLTSRFLLPTSYFLPLTSYLLPLTSYLPSLPYKKNSIRKKQLSTFPKLAKQRIVCKKNNKTASYVCNTE